MTACDPRGSDVVVKVADPAVRTEVPSLALPAEKVMLPVGTPFPDIGVTFAVKTVVPPKTGDAGFTERLVELETSDVCASFDNRTPPLQPTINTRPVNRATQRHS
jgi:hypothetical protein